MAKGRKIKFQDDSGEGRGGKSISMLLQHAILGLWDANDDFHVRSSLFCPTVVFRAAGSVIQAPIRAVGLLLCQEPVFGELQFLRLPLTAASPHPGPSCPQGMGQGTGTTPGHCWVAVSRTEVSFSPPRCVSPKRGCSLFAVQQE